MHFPFTLERATFLERPNRFLTHVRLTGGEVVRAHCPDPGRLRELLVPEAVVYVSRASKEHRTTSYDLRLVVHPENGTLISLDSRLPNALFAEAAGSGVLAPFPAPVRLRPEVPLPLSGRRIRSRADYVLEDGSGRRWWVEVKSATLVRDGVAYFPDAVTGRGARHVRELTDLAAKGEAAAVCFVVQRPDARVLKPEWDRDPTFAEALQRAGARGVALYAWNSEVTLQGARILHEIPVVTDP